MKQYLLFLAAMLLAWAPFQAVGQTDILVEPVELSVSFSAVPGRLVLAGTQVLFWSDAQQHPSFYFSKASVRRASVAAGMLTVELEEPISIQDGRRGRFEMRLSSDSDTVAIERWFNRPAGVAGPAPAMRSSAPSAPAEGLSYLAEHRKRFGRNSSGKLLFNAEGVVWESLDDATDSRTYAYKVIRRFDRKNPYELVIDTFNDGKYTFRFTGSPLGNEDFKTITDMLTVGRAGARQ